jgi:hypothetical protein
MTPKKTKSIFSPLPFFKGGTGEEMLRNIEVFFKKVDTTLARKRTERNPGIRPKSF